MVERSDCETMNITMANAMEGERTATDAQKSRVRLGFPVSSSGIGAVLLVVLKLIGLVR